ncbi:CAP domain-containing protein [Mucilaginibacter sp.]|uniref:CAP domain-containing protein n=1 Tax=Mucilaginibacter sp. TaxID=1882438 RepID=UPI003263F455
MRKYIFGALLLISVLTVCGFTRVQPDDSANFKQEFLRLINKTRAKGCNCGNKWYPPAAPMVWNDNLEQAARGHADDMYNRDYFNHTSKDGRSMSSRIVFAGYYFKGYKSFMVGENIAMGQSSIAEVMAGWFKSEGHCQNLMNPGFKDVGVAETNHYWVQDFGGRVSFSPEQQKLIKEGKYRLVQKEVDNH